MEWSTRPPPASNLQFTTANFCLPANESTQSSHSYPGNNQMIKIDSNGNSIVPNNLHFQNVGNSRNLHFILPKISVSSTDFGSGQHLIAVAPGSNIQLSSMTVQMPPCKPQNSNLMTQKHISSPVTLQRNNANPVQNIPQAVTPPVRLNSHNNQSLQKSSNSLRTSVYHQSSKNYVTPKGVPTEMPYYHVTGPPTSQANATVPFNQTSNQYLNSQQSFPCLAFPLDQNNQCQMQSQQLTSNNVNPPQYPILTHYNSRTAVQNFPQVTNVKPPPYPGPPVQRNHGYFVVQQQVANISNENVQNYHTPVLDQPSTSHSAHHGQKHLSVPVTREASETGSVAYGVGGHQAENQIPLETGKSTANVGGSLLNNVQTFPHNSSVPQTNKILEQESNLGKIPVNSLKNKINIRKDRLALATVQKLKTLLKDVEFCKIAKRCGILLAQNKQASDTLVHNQNSTSSLLPYNANQNQPLPLSSDASQGFQPTSLNTAQNQSFSHISGSSKPVKNVPVVPLRVDNHLMPILRNMLKGTADEDMLLNVCVEKGNELQNRQLITKDNSLSTDSSSGNLVNKCQKVMEEGSGELQKYASACLTLNQQNKNGYLQASEKNLTGRSENVSELNSSAFVLAKQSTCETVAVQKLSDTESSCEAGRVCSWEELKTGLALWRKNPPITVNAQIESPVSIPPPDKGAAGKNIQQMLDNLSSTLIQDSQIKAPDSNEIIPSFLEKSLNGVTPNLLKGSEPQVAIVTPLILSREIIQNEVKNDSLSVLEIDQAVKEGSISNLQKIISLVEETVDYTSGVLNKLNFNTQDKVTRSNDVKTEMHSDLLNQVSQEDIKSFESGPGLIGPGDLNNSELQISSVCTLVQGDEFYNSQIASIFNTSSDSIMKSEKTSEEKIPLLQHNNQEVGLENGSDINISSDTDFLLPSQESLSNIITEKLLEEVPNLEKFQNKVSAEMNARSSKEQNSNCLPGGTPILEKEVEQSKSGDFCSADLASISQELAENKKCQLSSAAHGEHADKKENAAMYLPVEQTLAHSGTGIEGSEVLLIDQLAELSEEFPYGIGDFKVLKKIESENSVSASLVMKDKKKICEETLDPTGAMEQIKIVMLNSQEINETFPKHSESSNILGNAESGQQNVDSKVKNSYRRENMDVSGTSSAETTDKKTKRTFCCLQGWLASLYPMKPCSCEPLKEFVSKQEIDCSSQYENPLKDEEKGNGNYKAGCRQNKLKISSLHHGNSDVTLGDQNNNILGATTGEEKSDLEVKNGRPSKVELDIVPFPSSEKMNSCTSKKIKEEVVEELPLTAPSQSLKMKNVNVDQLHGPTNTRESFSANQAQSQSKREDLKTHDSVPLRKKVKWRIRIEGGSLKSRLDACQQRRVEIKHSSYYERYKIKRVSSETHMIKGPIRNKELKRQKAKEKNHKALGIQHSEVVNSSTLSSVKPQKPRHKSALHSQEHFSRKKWESKIDLEKNYGYQKTNLPYVGVKKQTETSSSEPSGQKTITKSLKRGISLEKYAYSKEKKNSWKHRSSHLDNDDVSQKYRDRNSSISKTLCTGSESVLDAHNRDKYTEKCLSDKKVCFNRRPGKLSISLKKEQNKNYLNRVAFKRTAQKTIYLTNLEPHSKTVWHVKSSTVSGCSEDQKHNSLPSQQSEVEKPQMLEFKMCPEILFRNPVSEEQILNAKLPENETPPIKAVKSKREDWLNYLPLKKRKTEENQMQDDEIPFETALKLLDENEPFQMPRKDSKTTYETFRKMYLEKRSRSVDGV